MPKLAANLTTLFTETDFADRFRRASDAGFRAVECQFPYRYDPALLRQRLDEHDLALILHNMPAGDWDSGERGVACLPDRVAEFEAGVDHAIQFARTLGCARVNCLAGIRPDDLEIGDARATFIRNLRYAVPRFRAAGITLLIEALNTRDVPGFFLSGTTQAMEIVDDVHLEGLLIQFDVYHMHVMGEDVERMIERHLPRIGHVQIADAPGRHEPGSGEIRYPLLLPMLDRLGYSQWVGCEYQPVAETEEGLGWAKPYLRPSGM